MSRRVIAAVTVAACLPSASADARFVEVATVTGPLLSAAPSALGVAQAGAGRIAVFDGRTGAVRTIAIAPQCRVTGARGTHAALLCRTAVFGPTSQVVVVDLRDGSQAVANVPADVLAHATEATAGGRWLELLVYHGDSASGKPVYSRVLVDWRTGAAIDEAQDPFGVRSLIDLDRATAHRRLCRPARRMRKNVFDYDVSRYARTTLSQRWVLQEPGDDWLLRHCGEPRIRRIGGSASVSLADGMLFVRQHTARVRVERLDTGAAVRTTVPGALPPVRTTVAGGRRFLFATVGSQATASAKVLRMRLRFGRGSEAR